MSDLLGDVRLAARIAVRSLTSTVVTVFTLAVGLGASCTIFSVANAVLLRPLPYEDAERLVRLWEAAGSSRMRVSPANFVDWRDQAQIFSRIAAYQEQSLGVSGGGGEPEVVAGAAVSPGLPAVFGIAPILGRTLSSEDERSGERVLLLKEGYWRRRFAADPKILGRTLRISSEPYTVVGVLPDTMEFPRGTQIWLPLRLNPEEWSQRGGRYLQVVARLRDGVTMPQAAAALDGLAEKLAQRYPDANSGTSIEILPLREAVVGKIRPGILLLLGAVAFVLLASCANVTSLLLARVAGRQREAAIRTTLGASRPRLVRQLLTEYVLLALLGGVVSLGVARLGIELIEIFRPAELPIEHLVIDYRVVLFGLTLALLTGLTFGMVPALYGSGEKLGDSLRTGGAFLGRTGRDSRLLRNLFVVCEVALALVLLIGAGLTGRSFQRLYAEDPGFEPRNVLTLPISLPEQVYLDFPAYAAFFDRVLERVRVVPGVQHAAIVSTLPMTGSTLNFEVTPEGRPQPLPGEELYADYDIVSADYFQAMGIPLQAGRVFTEQDIADSPSVCIINETMARSVWRGENPIGRRLRIGDRGPNPRTIVGIVGDVRHGGLDERPTASVYVPYWQRPWSEMTLVVRASGNPAGLTSVLRREVWAVDKDLPLPQALLMDQVMAQATSQRRFSVLLLGVFAVVALILAATGIYGMLSYLVNERRHEIGIRIALGAGYAETRKLILKQGLVLTLAGLVFGLVLAFLLTRLLTHLLYEVSATDPVVFVAVSLALLAVALAASYIPTLRAVRISPLISLKEG